MWWHLLVGLVATVVVLWLALLVLLWRARALAPAEALRLLPDTLRLLSRLARDPSLPRSTRWRLWLALGYLALPLDLVPDFLPGIGYLDDVLVVALALRSVDAAALARNWPGSADGLSESADGHVVVHADEQLRDLGRHR